MHPERRALFAQLQRAIGGTHLHRVTRTPVPNGNSILIKLEAANPTGSHYDRVYAQLLMQLEDQGAIDPARNHLIEVSSGNAGASFAWLCSELGYAATVIVPEDLPVRRIQPLLRFGTHVIRTPAEAFIRGCVATLRKVLNEHRPAPDGRRYYCPDHSRSETSVIALEEIAREVLRESDQAVDYFVAAVGNGISIVGPGRVLQRECGTKVIAWDPLAAPTAYEKRYPGCYKETYGIDAGGLGLHHIYGTGVLGVEFPMLDRALAAHGAEMPLVESVHLVADQESLARLSYLVREGKATHSALVRAHELPDLSAVHGVLATEEQLPVGYSSAGSYAVARRLAESVQGKTILIICYDEISKY